MYLYLSLIYTKCENVIYIYLHACMLITIIIANVNPFVYLPFPKDNKGYYYYYYYCFYSVVM